LSYRLNLARINLNNANAGIHQLLPQRIRKDPHRALRSAVDAATRIRVPRGNASDVDDVAAAALGPGLEDGQDSLRHVY
jgi:hypothetical protein